MPTTTSRRATLVFDEADSQRAHREWGANCGPNALAFALGMTLDEVRPHMGDFETKHYTNPMLMKACLKSLGLAVTVSLPCGNRQPIIPSFTGLCRIQWTGPWTAPGANPKWAYRQTHWVAPYVYDQRLYIFDCNGGERSFPSWRDEIVPILARQTPRADGGWFPTHCWEISKI